MWIYSQFSRRKTTVTVIKREHSRQLGCTQTSSPTPTRICVSCPVPFSTEQMTGGIQGEQAVTDKMRVLLSRSGNAITDPCCKVFQVRDLLRDSFCKDKAKDRIYSQCQNRTRRRQDF